jgi:hypothetical protein
MRAIWQLSILNNDFICILDLNKRFFSRNVSQFRVREVQVPIPKLSITTLTYDEEIKCFTNCVVYLGSCGLATFRKSFCNHRILLDFRY